MALYLKIRCRIYMYLMCQDYFQVAPQIALEVFQLVQYVSWLHEGVVASCASGQSLQCFFPVLTCVCTCHVDLMLPPSRAEGNRILRLGQD